MSQIFEWETEPNGELFRDDEVGYLCLIKRMPLKNLCGYVGVTKDHPWYGMDMDFISASVHGGVTFTDWMEELAIPDGIQRWWVGFDCAHSGDTIPGLIGFRIPGIYRNWAYVKSECRSLAAQARIFDIHNQYRNALKEVDSA